MLDAHPKYCIRRRYKTKNEAKPRMENSATPLRPYANSFVKMNNIPWCLPIRPGTSRTSSKRSLPSIGLYPKSRRMCKHVRKHATKGSTVSRLFLSFLPSFLSFFVFSYSIFSLENLRFLPRSTKNSIVVGTRIDSYQNTRSSFFFTVIRVY